MWENRYQYGEDWGDFKYTETDNHSFHFNLKSTRFEKPRKFCLGNPERSGYLLYDSNRRELILVGDIMLYKEEYKSQSYYSGNGNFTPKRIIVLRMGN